MLKRQRQHRKLHQGHTADSSTRGALGRFRKKDPFDCGKPGCQLCHFDKIHGLKGPKELKADAAFAHDLNELKNEIR